MARSGPCRKASRTHRDKRSSAGRWDSKAPAVHRLRRGRLDRFFFTCRCSRENAAFTATGICHLPQPFQERDEVTSCLGGCLVQSDHATDDSSGRGVSIRGTCWTWQTSRRPHGSAGWPAAKVESVVLLKITLSEVGLVQMANVAWSPRRISTWACARIQRGQPRRAPSGVLPELSPLALLARRGRGQLCSGRKDPRASTEAHRRGGPASRP